MDMLLKFLTRKIQSADGKAGSAIKLMHALNHQSIREYKKGELKIDLRGDYLFNIDKRDCGKVVMFKINEINSHVLYRKVWLKYLIMRVRSKISYFALCKRETVPELIIKQCLKSFDLFKNEGLFP